MAGSLCISSVTERPDRDYNALVCDLDGTLLHSQEASIAVPGRTRASFLSEGAAQLLANISRIFPLVIATGRNAVSVNNLVKQLPDVIFSGFVLENGFVVKQKIDDKIEHNSEWDRVAALFPEWERLPFYENCAGFIFSPSCPPLSSADSDLYMTSDNSGAPSEREYISSDKSVSPSDNVDIDKIAQYAEKTLMENGYDHLVYKEKRKIFIYPGHVDKMRGLALLGVHPYIAMGDGSNDLEMLQQSSCPVGLISGAPELREIVIQKDGFCSMHRAHSAACEMLEFAYEKIRTIG